jgi:hypothetical protein
MIASAGAQRTAVSPAEVATAIEQGQAGKTLQKKCSASGENGFDVVIEGPVGRIMRAAREARRADRAFTAADVTPALDGPFLTVTARRDRRLASASLATPMPGVPGGLVPTELATADRVRDGHTGASAYRPEVIVRRKPAGKDEGALLKPRWPLVDNGEADASAAWTPADGRPLLLPSPGSDLTATFDLAAFRAMPHGDVEVVIFTSDAGERRCKISDKDRQAIK